MTLKDKIDDEISSVNENIEPIITKFSFIDAAEAYINAHPEEPYGIILDSGEDEDMVRVQIKEFVYGKILNQLVIEHEARLPNAEKYGRWVEEQQDLINNEAYCYGLAPEEMMEQYDSWIRSSGKFNFNIRQLIQESLQPIPQWNTKKYSAEEKKQLKDQFKYSEQGRKIQESKDYMTERCKNQ